MRRLVLWCAFGIAVVPAVAARGIDLVVNSTLDQIDADVTDGICQTAAGTCTLRAAVMTANRATGAVRVDILVPPGTFEITRPPIGRNGDDGGDLDLTAPLSGNPLIVLQGAGVGATVIDALDADRVVRVHAGRRAVIQDLTLRQGFAAQTTDGFRRFEQRLSSHRPSANNVFRPQYLKLTLKKWPAVIYLRRQRRPILRRPAFQHVHDINIRPLPPAGLDDFCQ